MPSFPPLQVATRQLIMGSKNTHHKAHESHDRGATLAKKASEEESECISRSIPVAPKVTLSQACFRKHNSLISSFSRKLEHLLNPLLSEQATQQHLVELEIYIKNNNEIRSSNMNNYKQKTHQ